MCTVRQNVHMHKQVNCLLFIIVLVISLFRRLAKNVIQRATIASALQALLISLTEILISPQIIFVQSEIIAYHVRVKCAN